MNAAANRRSSGVARNIRQQGRRLRFERGSLPLTRSASGAARLTQRPMPIFGSATGRYGRSSVQAAHASAEGAALSAGFSTEAVSGCRGAEMRPAIAPRAK